MAGRVWPGAVELGLQDMPKLSPIRCSLAGPDAQTWLNQLAAEDEKGAPLTVAERRRILRGTSWKPRHLRDKPR